MATFELQTFELEKENKMLRSVLAVIGGFLLWSLVWVASNQLVIALFPRHVKDDGGIDQPAVLLMLITVSLALSFLSGYLVAVWARRKEVPHAAVLGAVLLAVGVFVQVQYWEVMPLWYHLCFLGLLLPGAALGGWLRDLRSPALEPA